MKKISAHPYIPNSVPEIKRQMLDEIGLTSVEAIFKAIPDHLRFKGKMNIPGPIMSECRLKRHVEKILAKNENCSQFISFLGGGCWQHYVPAVCDTIGSRDEFLTAYVGDAYSDHGKFQALFESASMIGELVGMEVVSAPSYDWANALAMACRMATRKTGRREILYCSSLSPERLLVIQNYCKPEIRLIPVEFNPDNGLMALADLQEKISENTAAVYFENPTYFGNIEVQAPEIVKIAREAGAEAIVGVDPVSLGVLEAPGAYGATIVVGDLQPLGLHLQFGGALGGFIATPDEKEYVAEYPTVMYGLTTTAVEGEYGFGQVFYERTSYAAREKGKDSIGTTTALHAIIAGVYLALMGPQGMFELGEGIMQRVAYAKKQLSGIKGVKLQFQGNNFKEFVVNFDGTGKTVGVINEELKAAGIFGGHDLSPCFPQLGQSALYCITEIHSQEDIEQLISALRRICA